MNIAIEPGTLLSLITLVAGITIYSFLRSRHAERMQQLQMGIPLEKGPKSYIEIKLGSLFMGIGVGFVFALLLTRTYFKGAGELYPAFIFLFGGAGLLLSYFLTQRLNNQQPK